VRDTHSDPSEQRSGSLWCALGLLIVCGLGMAARPADDHRLWDLKPDVPIPDVQPARDKPWVLREQTIVPRDATLALLQNIKEPLPPPLILDLLDGTSPTLTVRARAVGGTGSVVVTGWLNGEPANEASLSIKQRILVGTLRVGTRLWVVKSSDGNTHRLMEIDPEKLPKD